MLPCNSMADAAPAVPSTQTLIAMMMVRRMTRPFLKGPAMVVEARHAGSGRAGRADGGEAEWGAPGYRIRTEC